MDLVELSRWDPRAWSRGLNSNSSTCYVILGEFTLERDPPGSVFGI